MTTETFYVLQHESSGLFYAGEHSEGFDLFCEGAGDAITFFHYSDADHRRGCLDSQCSVAKVETVFRITDPTAEDK